MTEHNPTYPNKALALDELLPLVSMVSIILDSEITESSDEEVSWLQGDVLLINIPEYQVLVINPDADFTLTQELALEGVASRYELTFIKEAIDEGDLVDGCEEGTAVEETV